MVFPVLAGCEEPKSEAPPKPIPVIGKDPIPELLTVEDHGMALARWAEQGIRDAVLINIDTHDDMRLIHEDKIIRLKELYRKKDWKGITEADSSADQGLYHVGNWIYAGVSLGIIKEVYWGNSFSLFFTKKCRGTFP